MVRNILEINISNNKKYIYESKIYNDKIYRQLKVKLKYHDKKHIRSRKAEAMRDILETDIGTTDILETQHQGGEEMAFPTTYSSPH